jgi:hypothetical protein
MNPNACIFLNLLKGLKMNQGICLECKEWTDPEESCCGAGVVVEGSIIFESEEENEINNEKK